MRDESDDTKPSSSGSIKLCRIELARPKHGEVGKTHAYHNGRPMCGNLGTLEAVFDSEALPECRRCLVEMMVLPRNNTAAPGKRRPSKRRNALPEKRRGAAALAARLAKPE